MRIRRFAIVVILLLVAACTDTSAPETTTLSPTSTPQAKAESFTATGAAVDPTDVLAAVERLTVTPHRAESFFEFPEEEADGPDPNQPVAAYEFDGTWSSSTIFLGPHQADGEPMGFTITDRSTAYFYLPGLADTPESVRAFSDDPMVDAYESWIVVDFEPVRAAVPADVPVTIQQSAVDELEEIIETLRGATTTKEGPRSSSRGVETRTYELIVEAEGEIELLSSTSIFTIHLDAQDQVREITSENDFFGSRIEFFDFDQDITIELPADALDRTAEFVEQFASVAAALPTPAPVRPFDGPTVLELLDAQPELSIFRELIAASDNAETMLDLPNPEPWTIFAPTNSALEAIGPALDEVRSDPLLARTFVLEHIVKGSYSLADLAEVDQLQTFAGWNLTFNSRNGTTAVGFLTDVQPILVGDRIGGDGVVHVIPHTLSSSID